MARNNRKRLKKLQKYRDKLLIKTVRLEGEIRQHKESFSMIRKALSRDPSDTLRAYTLSTAGIDDVTSQHDPMWISANELAKELALVYRFMNVEREYVAQIMTAVSHRDYLRIAALTAMHHEEMIEHDALLQDLSQQNGFTRKLRKEVQDENAENIV